MNRGTIKQVKVEKGKVQIMVHLDLNTKIENTQYNIWVCKKKFLARLVAEKHYYDVTNLCKALCLLTNGMKCEFGFDMKDCKITSITFLGAQNS